MYSEAHRAVGADTEGLGSSRQVTACCSGCLQRVAVIWKQHISVPLFLTVPGINLVYCCLNIPVDKDLS